MNISRPYYLLNSKSINAISEITIHENIQLHPHNSIIIIKTRWNADYYLTIKILRTATVFKNKHMAIGKKVIVYEQKM